MENEEQNIGASRRPGPGPGTWALMALVAVITAIAVWLVPVDDKNTAPSLPALPPVQQTADSLPSTGGPDTSAAAAPMTGEVESSAADTSIPLELPSTPGGVATVTNGGEGAREFLYKLRASGGQPDPDVVFAEAERLQDQGDLENAYLLYRYAARHGHTRAAMTLGTAADPAWYSPGTSYLAQPSPGQAYKWYSMAAAAGDAEAGQRLDALHERLQQNAAAGDEQAQRLLLQWR